MVKEFIPITLKKNAHFLYPLMSINQKNIANIKKLKPPVNKINELVHKCLFIGKCKLHIKPIIIVNVPIVTRLRNVLLLSY